GDARGHDPRVRRMAPRELADRLVQARIVRLERAGDDPRRHEDDLAGEREPGEESSSRSALHASHLRLCTAYKTLYTDGGRRTFRGALARAHPPRRAPAGG